MLNLGLEFLLEPKDMCSVLTTVFVPPHINIDIFRQKLRDKSIIIYEGKGCFKGRVFQVGNIGELSRKDILLFLTIQGNILRECEVDAQANVTSILDHLPLQPMIINEKILVSESSV